MGRKGRMREREEEREGEERKIDEHYPNINLYNKLRMLRMYYYSIAIVYYTITQIFL